MRRWSRLVLVWMLAIALPLQAAAHEWLSPCLAGKAGTGAAHAMATAGSGHGAAHAQAAVPAMASEGHAAAMHAGLHDGPADHADPAGPHDAAAVAHGDGGCAWCATLCGAGLALLPADRGLPLAAETARDWAPPPAARIAAAAVGGLERPPRG